MGQSRGAAGLLRTAKNMPWLDMPVCCASCTAMSASTALGSMPSTAIGKLASTGTAKSCTIGGSGSSGAPRKKKREKQPTRKSIAASTCATQEW